MKHIIEKAKKWYRLGRLDRLDWITRNQLIMEKNSDLIEKEYLRNSTKENRQHILFWSGVPWERGGVEHMLAISMRARGHRITGLRCSSHLPTCSMESKLFPRPECMGCIDRHSRLLKSLGLEDHYLHTSEYLSRDEIISIEKEIDQLSDVELQSYQYQGLGVGELAIKDLPQYFFKLVSLNDADVVEYLRKSIKAISSYALIASRCLSQLEPDKVVMTSGRTATYTAMYQLCIRMKIHVVTWDEAIGGDGAFIFCPNNYAVNYQKPNAWKEISEKKLTEKEDAFVDHFFSLTQKGIFGRHKYYNNTISDQEEILSALDFNSDMPIHVFLTNLTWDTSALDKDVAFKSMIDWLEKVIDFFIINNDHQIVVRTHPGEGHLPEYARGCESVSEVLFKKYPHLPANIKIISGEDELSSHALCNMAQSISVYTTTVGLEMAMKGREVFVVGDSHYRGKGFTIDVKDRDEYLQNLLKVSTETRRSISQEKIELARRYAYFFIVRTQSYLEEFNLKDRHRYEVIDCERFLPNQNNVWDKLCWNLENNGEFVDCSEYIENRPS